ncbi:hypothetical protein NHX12_023667 [Muraenolepis orangiensis]|uniref:Uncharacterized protein n=1 Tax=Muraenolepis orangiensis TaxID=630683 RepID=A0A9Q0EMJ6_9TELE|nr:hypothetical protein NHX12_023667 [Muraenolepis orangiensis]
MGADGEEEEEDEDLDQAEVQRRRERLEKEQWLREQSEQKAQKGPSEPDAEDEENLGEEDSQFMKLAKKFTAKTLQRKEASVVPAVDQKSLACLDPFQKASQTTRVNRGSLLSQPRSVLQKLASISEGNPLAPRSTRGFLFQTLSPEKDSASTSASGPKKQVKRGPAETTNPASKRVCRPTGPNRPSGAQRSIFSFLEN